MSRSLLMTLCVLVLPQLSATPSLAQTDTTRVDIATASQELLSPLAPATSEFAWVPEAGDVIDFKVLRNGSKFGSHKISFSGDASGELQVRSEVALKAGLGPITVFKYALDTTETWRDGVLVGLKGAGNNDGKKMKVAASADTENLNVDGTEFVGSVPLGIVPSSHWNIAQIRGSQMVSTEDGEIIAVRSEKVKTETLEIAGESVLADHYLLDAAIDLDLWYDQQSRLVKLAFETKGQSIVYELRQLY